jgi:PIN domain nuclease of toxin-antitoxin system
MRRTFLAATLDRPLLLDTHIWLWLVHGNSTLSPATKETVKGAANAGQLRVSVITVWEVGKLVARGRIILGKPLVSWVEDAVASSGGVLEPITSQIAAASCELPDGFRSDPGDEIIIATARAIDAVLMTRDREILDYAARGHMNAQRA